MRMNCHSSGIVGDFLHHTFSHFDWRRSIDWGRLPRVRLHLPHLFLSWNNMFKHDKFRERCVFALGKVYSSWQFFILALGFRLFASMLFLSTLTAIKESWSWLLKQQVSLSISSSSQLASLFTPKFLPAAFKPCCCNPAVATFSFSSSNPPHRIYSVYNSVGYNCFIAAGVYLLVAAFSCCQMRLNKQKVGK